MGQSELESTYRNWAKRVAQYSQLGIPAAAYTPIAQQDMHKVATDQGGAMTNEQAAAAVYAAASKINPLQSQQALTQRHRSGILGGIEDTIGNIGSDVGHIITGAPAGIGHLVSSVVTPGGWKHTGAELSAAAHDIGQGDFGKALRDAAQVPAIDLIPGVADAAALTTAAGRQQLATHPVSAALDVMPLTRPLAAGTGLAVAARAGSDTLSEALGQATSWDKVRGKVDVRSEDPSALAALTSGRPVQAGLRLMDRSVLNKVGATLGQQGGKLGEHMTAAQLRDLGPGQLAWQRAGVATGMSKAARDAGTAVTRENLKIQSQLQTLADGIVKGGGLKIPRAKLAEYTEKIALGDRQSLDQVGRLLYDRYAIYRADEEARGLAAEELAQTRVGVYSTESVVPRRERQLDRAIARQGKVHADLTAAQAAHASAQLDHAKAVAQASQHGRTRQLTPLGNVRKLPQSKSMTGLPGTMPWATQQMFRRIGTAQSRVDAAAAKVAHHTARRELMRRVVDKARVQYEKSYLKEPPRHLQPKVQELLRAKASKAAVAVGPARRAELAQMSDAKVLAAYDHAYATMHKTGVMADFEQLVGKEETTALFHDAINEAIAMERDGLIAPLYVPTVYKSDLSSIMSPHRLAQERDLRESQVRKAAFTMTSPLMDLHASIVKEQAEHFLRQGMQQVWDTHLQKQGKTFDEIRAPYEAAAERLKAAGKLHHGESLHDAAMNLMARDWKLWKFDQYGIKQRATGGSQALSDVYLPRDVVESMETMMGTKNTGALATAEKVFQSAGYAKGMRLFRFSVLYGPRHFAHVVVGGLVSMALADPGAFRQFPKLFPVFMDIAKGKPVQATHIGTMPIDPIITTHFDYRTDPFYKVLQQKAGHSLGQLLKDYWEKMHLPTGERFAAIEDAAQSIYQLAVQLNAVKKGLDPLMALEKARQVVVNMEGMSAFERVVLKQVMPFYTFTRYATRFMWNLPFEHPLRVAILSSMANQATEEWGTGLPQTMMTLFFFGQPDAKGNVWSVNLRNANPFRSVANMFTWGGFFSSLNPAMTAPLVAAGFNPLEGSGQLYPELVYDPASGALRTKKPSGGLMAAAEQVVPELGGVDALLGISDNYRYLLKNDRQAFDRQMMNAFNIPFQVSQYNIPSVRGKVAVNTLRAATQAVTAYKKGGRYEDTIGRYTLIPYNGSLIPPQQFSEYWQSLKARYGSVAAIPAPAQSTANPMANLAQYYATQG